MTRWKTEIPTEEEEQIKLARYLDANGFIWFHTPNEGKHKVQYRAKQKKMGLKAGVPDVLIFDCPDERHNGVAIELKRQKGGQIRDSQVQWITELGKRKWYAKVAHGADEAIDFLEELFES